MKAQASWRSNLMNKKIFALFFFLFSILFLVACNGQSKTMTDVSVQLKWLHQAQFSGNYVAVEEGYYADEGLNVTLNPVNFDEIASIEELVASGASTFGISGADQVLIARSKGLPVKAVAVVYRINPLVLVSIDDVLVYKPADLIGKTVGAHQGQATIVSQTMLKNAGVDLSQVNFVQPTTFNALECLATADVCSAYSIDGVVEIELKGHTPHVLWPNEYGVPFYADVIFTTDDYIAQHPDIVAAFVRATFKGWQKSIEDPNLAVKDILVFDPTLDQAFQLASVNASIPLVDTGSIQLGVMEGNIWQLMYTTLLEQGQFAAPFDILQAYTNQFVESSK